LKTSGKELFSVKRDYEDKIFQTRQNQHSEKATWHKTYERLFTEITGMKKEIS